MLTCSTPRHYEVASRVIGKTYKLGRSATRRETDEEIANLNRRNKAGTLDDFQLPYFVRLEMALERVNRQRR
jgi:hypothetical protein